jgi:hypothetical protein
MKKKMYIIPASQTAEITTLYRLCDTSAGGNTDQDVDINDEWGKFVF